MRGWTLARLLVVPLAGCAGTQPPASPSLAPSQDAASARIEAPEWSIGDWWTYDVGGTVTWVVTEDQGSHWTVDVDDPQWAFYDQAISPTSTIGAIAKGDLDGSQEAGAVAFFRFPLEQGKSWPMVWDGIAFNATVVSVEGPRAQLRAEAADGAVRRYVYDAEARWFRSLSAHDANGSLEFEATLQQHGQEYAGTYARWTLFEPYEKLAGFGDYEAESFQVPAEATDIWFRYSITCSPGGLEGEGGAFVLEVHPQDASQGISQTGTCPTQRAAEGTMPVVPGEWGVTLATAGGTIDVAVRPRALQELSLA